MDGDTYRRFRPSYERRAIFVNEMPRGHVIDFGERDFRYRLSQARTEADPAAELYERMASQEAPLLNPVSHERLRSTRSHSLKAFTMQPPFAYQRSKRTFSLPCATRPILPPGIQIEQSRFIDEDIIEEPGNKPGHEEDTYKKFGV